MEENVKDKLNDEFDFKIKRGEFVRYDGEQKDWGFQAFCFVIHN